MITQTSLVKIDFKTVVKLRNTDIINLRGVWKALNIKMKFPAWVKRDILPNFLDIREINKGANAPLSKAGRPRKDFSISVREAKRIAMGTRTDAGRAIQDYFLECEELVYENGLEDQLTTKEVMDTFTKAIKIKDLEHTVTKGELEREELRHEITKLKLAEARKPKKPEYLYSAQIAKMFPLLVPLAESEYSGRNFNRFSTTGKLTMYLTGVLNCTVYPNSNNTARFDKNEVTASVAGIDTNPIGEIKL